MIMERKNDSLGGAPRVVVAIETGSGRGGVVLAAVGHPTRTFADGSGGSRSENILRLLQEGLESIGAVPGQIERIVCSDGPGSLTGLRIGKSIAKGLSDSLRVPLRYVSAFEAMIGSAGGKRDDTGFVVVSGGNFHAAFFAEGKSEPVYSDGKLATFGEWAAGQKCLHRIVIPESDWCDVSEGTAALAGKIGGEVMRLPVTLGESLVKYVLSDQCHASDNDIKLWPNQR